MPNCSIEFSPFLDILLLFGLALLSVVNSTVNNLTFNFFVKIFDQKMYLAIQRYFLSAIEYLVIYLLVIFMSHMKMQEELLETGPSADQHERQEGYFVFRSLAPNIQVPIGLILFLLN